MSETRCRCDETYFLGECPKHPDARKVVAVPQSTTMSATRRAEEEQPCAVPIAERAQNLRDHYDEVSTAAGHWCNQIPVAIDEWEAKRLLEEEVAPMSTEERVKALRERVEVFLREMLYDHDEELHGGPQAKPSFYATSAEYAAPRLITLLAAGEETP